MLYIIIVEKSCRFLDEPHAIFKTSITTPIRELHVHDRPLKRIASFISRLRNILSLRTKNVANINFFNNIKI